MNDYQNDPLWQRAYATGKQINHLCSNRPSGNMIIRHLNQSAGALVTTIALLTPDTPCVTDLRLAFEHAHDGEFLLFMSLYFGYLEYEPIRGIIPELHTVKLTLVEILSKTLRAES